VIDYKHLAEDNFPIQIFVSYPWAKNDENNITVRTDVRWRSLSNLLKKVATEVHNRSKNYNSGERNLDIRINCLRGRHGQFLLKTLRQRIERGNILIADIGNTQGDGLNPNVLIELGVALRLDKLDSESLYILKPKKVNLPSDLNGILISEYDLKDGEIKLTDEVGFNAALRSTLMDFASIKKMIGLKKKSEIEIDGETVEKKN
jgi:hypothetical protein